MISPICFTNFFHKFFLVWTGCNTFGPKLIWSLDFRSPTTNDPHKIDPPGQMVLIKFGPHGQMVPENLVPMDKWSPTNLVPVFLDPHSLSPEQKEYSKDHLSMGIEFLGTICPWGLNWLGTISPEGPINWGPIVGDQMCSSRLNSWKRKQFFIGPKQGFFSSVYQLKNKS